MRLFIAVDVDDPIREKIKPVLSELSRINGVKAVEPENLHITLLFLGEVNESRVSKIEEKLSEVEFEPFKILFEGVGAFPNVNSPRVVWVGVKESGELTGLANNIYEKLKKLGFRRDKEFKAHLTVGRVKRKNPEVSEVIKRHASENFGEMEIRSFRLKQSILTPKGPIYKDLRVFE